MVYNLCRIATSDLTAGPSPKVGGFFLSEDPTAGGCHWGCRVVVAPQEGAPKRYPLVI